MTEPEDRTHEFESYPWHDSRLLEVRVTPGEAASENAVACTIQLISHATPGKCEYKTVQVLFRRCRIVKLDLDLLGLQLCGGAIASGSCREQSDMKTRILEEQIASFDLPQDLNPFDDLLHFSFEFIHPGGTMDIFARDFEIRQ